MEGFGYWLIYAPMWVVALALVGGLIGAALFGWWLRHRRSAPEDAASDQEGYILTAVSGLLALLIGFTFSMAIDRFDQRRDRVLQDAQAIQSAYLKAQILADPYRTQISKLLVEYTDNRIELGEAKPGREADALLAKNEQFLTELWATTVAVFPTIRSFDFSSSFVDAMSDVIQLDIARKEGRRAHVPARVYAILFVYEFVAAAVFGYVLSGRRGREIAGFLLLLFAMSMLLVIDLDRPATGRINESQDAMIMLSRSLHARPPTVFGPPATQAR
jgi:MFS family permease